MTLVAPVLTPDTFTANAELVDGNYYGWVPGALWRLEKVDTPGSDEEFFFHLTFLRSTGFGKSCVYEGSFQDIPQFITAASVHEWSLAKCTEFEEEVYQALGQDTTDACHQVRKYFKDLHGVEILNYLTFAFPSSWFNSEIPDPLEDISQLVQDRFQNTLILDELGLTLPILDYRFFKVYKLGPTCLNYNPHKPYILVEYGTAPPIYTQNLTEWSLVEYQFVQWGFNPTECVEAYYRANPSMDWVDLFQDILTRMGYDYQQIELTKVLGQFAMKDSLHVLTWPSVNITIKVPQILRINAKGLIEVSHLDYVSAYADLADAKAEVINTLLQREGIYDLRVTAHDLAASGIADGI